MPKKDTFLYDAKRRIERTLRIFFKAQIHKSESGHALSKKLMQQVAEFTLRPGAKRMRGTLVLLGFLANPKKKIDNNILKVAAAYEILHSYLLIHDDIIDRDSMRRGKPTLHRQLMQYAPKSLRNSEKVNIGIYSAIIAGDLAADLSQRLILDSNFTSAKKLATLTYIEKILHSTYVGQVLDILAVPQALPTIDEQYLRYLLKTAIYSIEAPFLLGVLLGDASINKSRFRVFASQVGLAFQLSDDIQNLYSTGLSGRSSDIRAGKVTLLISLALENKKNSSAILKLLKKEQRTVRDIGSLRRLIKDSGGYELATKLVEAKYEKAASILDSIHLPHRVSKQFTLLLSLLKSYK